MNHQIATSIDAELLEQPPLGLRLNYIDAEGELAIYKPSSAAFEISEKGPGGFNASGYILFFLRLQLRNCLIKNGFAPENIDLNICSTEVSAWKVFKERFYWNSSAMSVVEKICKVVAQAFGINDAQACINVSKQNGFFDSHIVLIDFNKLLDKLLFLYIVDDEVELSEAASNFIQNFW